MKFILVLLLSVLCLATYAQMDSTAMVTDIYQRASKFYEVDKFTDALSLLERAETLSPKPDAKILYLKSKLLNSLYQANNSYGSALEKAFIAFEDAAKKQNYPPAKVQEITQLQQQFISSRNQLKPIVSTTEPAVTVTQQKAVESRSATTYQPESSATQRAESRRIYEEQNKFLEPDFARAKRMMTHKGVGKAIFTILFIGGGVAAILAQSSHNAHPYRNKYDPLTGTTTQVEDGNKSSVGYYLGGFSIGTGILILSARSSKKKGQMLLDKTLDKQRALQQKYLSFSPKFNFLPGASEYGFSLRLKF